MQGALTCHIIECVVLASESTFHHLFHLPIFSCTCKVQEFNATGDLTSSALKKRGFWAVRAVTDVSFENMQHLTKKTIHEKSTRSICGPAEQASVVQWQDFRLPRGRPGFNSRRMHIFLGPPL